MQTLVDIYCTRGTSLREAIANDRRLSKHGLEVLKEHQPGRAPGWAKLRGNKPESQGVVNYEWDASAQVLRPVEITANAADAGLDKVGFNQRRRGAGGYFITSEDLEKRNPNLLTDIFRTVPSLRVVPSGTDYVIQNARNPVNGCVKYYIDGAPWEAIFAGDVDRLLPPWEIAAIEVYNGANTPMQFQAPGASNCASIVIWSKTRTGGHKR